jgi:hypothetical protein
MKKIIASIVSIVSLMVAGTLVYADSGATVSAEVPVLTSFTSRGRVFQDNAVYQPNITVSKQVGSTTLFVNDWENVNTDRSHGNIFNETDLTLGGITPLNKAVTVNYGLINYIYSDMLINAPVVVEDTREVYLGVTTTYLGINPSVTTYYDIEQANGGYIMLGINRAFSCSKSGSMIADTSIGMADGNYNNFYFGVDKTQLNDWSSGLTYSYAISSKATMSTGIRYSYLLNDAIREGAESSYDGGNMMIGKVSLIYNF